MDYPVAYEWQPIEDLGDNAETLAVSELRALAQVWNEQRDRLEKLEALRVFNEQLMRQWSIETGIIERIYELDRGITQLLIEKGLDASLITRDATDRDPELVAAIIQDHHDAVEGLFAFVRGDRSLSTSYVKELHAALTRHQATTVAATPSGQRIEIPLCKGEYKQAPNNPLRQNGTLHEYCPPEQTASEMDRLIALHEAHQPRSIAPEVEAAWLHHRFTQIHPFQDGNGRVARCLATLVMIKAGWFPLVITRDDRERYIAALEAADHGDLRELVALFAAVERRAFVSALSTAGDVLRRKQVQQIIDAVEAELQRRHLEMRAEWEEAKGTARSLQEVAVKRLQQVANDLETRIEPLVEGYAFFVDDEPPAGDRGYYFRYQIIDTARALGYFANTRTYRAWTRLVLRTESQAEILISYHGIGREYRGLLAISACFFRREETSTEGDREIAGITPLSEEIFQVNYRESLRDASARFERWLENALVKGLEIWRRDL